MGKISNKGLASQLRDTLAEKVSRQLVCDDTLTFIIQGTSIISLGNRDVLNRTGATQVYVKATHWFDSFWFYICIKILRDEDQATELPFVSISFFQEQGNELVQLFRAEWDNFNQDKHPQPHWHLSPDMRRQTFKDLETSGVIAEDSPFAELDGNMKAVNIPKMHFAMAGDWMQGSRLEMIRKCNSEDMLTHWINNLFDHVRQELTYAN